MSYTKVILTVVSGQSYTIVPDMDAAMEHNDRIADMGRQIPAQYVLMTDEEPTSDLHEVRRTLLNTRTGWHDILAPDTDHPAGGTMITINPAHIVSVAIS